MSIDLWKAILGSLVRHWRAVLIVNLLGCPKAGGFVASKLILSLISAVAHAAFFRLIDLPYWLPMGVFAGFTAQLIPIIGTYLGVAAPLVISLTDQPTDGIWIIVFATIYQQIENYYLTPRVSRATMDIHPAVALGAVFAGIAIWGPIGVESFLEGTLSINLEISKRK